MSPGKAAVLFGAGALLFLLIGRYAPASFLGHFTVFVLACFIGYMVVWNVKPALHTPLMSVTNAVSSIIAIGALVQIAPPLLGGGAARPEDWIRWLSVVGIGLTAITMFGGFAATRRLLAMFRKSEGRRQMSVSLTTVAYLGATIGSSDQYSSDPEGGTFFLRMEFTRPAGTQPEELAAQFRVRVAERFAMRWRLWDTARDKRVAILVSREDHCLLELLWGRRRGARGAGG